MSYGLEILDSIPRLGWVHEPSPVTSLPALAKELGLTYVGIKRDDQLDALGGGNKPRKLDYLLATEPFASAPGWHSMGAIGSGHLVALAAAAALMDRHLHAHCFWEPLSGNVLDNLGLTASGPTTLYYYASRLRMGLRRPRLLLSPFLAGLPVIPPGGTTTIGMLGFVQAGLELGIQIRDSLLPCPDRIYVALGTGGTAAGLAVGLGLAGIETRLHGVTVVEQIFSSRRRQRLLAAMLLSWLAGHGITAARHATSVPLVVDRSQLGRGYGQVTEASLDACATLEAHGLQLEPVYTGKAMAALRADAGAGGLKSALFWMTAHRPAEPQDLTWRDRLPSPLGARLAGSSENHATR